MPVDDGHVGIDPLVVAIDAGDVGSRGEDTADAGRDGLCSQLDALVGHDGVDRRVGRDLLALALVERGAEALQGVAEGVLGLEGGLALQALEGLGDVGVAGQKDDVAISRVGRCRWGRRGLDPPGRQPGAAHDERRRGWWRLDDGRRVGGPVGAGRRRRSAGGQGRDATAPLTVRTVPVRCSPRRVPRLPTITPWPIRPSPAAGPCPKSWWCGTTALGAARARSGGGHPSGSLSADRQRFLPRTSTRWAVHGDVVLPSMLAELPYQPQTHVTVWSRCL